MAVTAMKPKNAVESLRDIVQDLLVPELKALKAEMDSQRRENQTQFEAIRTELKIRTDAISTELQVTTNALRSDTESLRVEMRIRDERQTEALQALRTEMSLRFEHLDGRLGTLLEVRERLAVLEDRAKHS